MTARALMLWLFMAVAVRATPAAGRWDLQATSAAFSYPCWIEIAASDGDARVCYVGRVGAVKPIRDFELAGEALSFSHDEWFGKYERVRHTLRFAGDDATGAFTRADGTVLAVTGRRSPALDRAAPARWSEPRAIFNGRDLSGWEPLRGANPPSNWRVDDDVIVLAKGGPGLRTTERFDDFKLRAEYSCPAEGNTGIYLRGRYELQLEEESAVAPPDRRTGAIYGFVGPAEAPPRRPDAWRSLEVTLVGRRVTVVLDGSTLYADREIPGITGEALDSDEGAPGPFVLQASHRLAAGVIRFRNLTVATPAR